MDNLLSSIQSSKSLQLVENQQSCWVLRANVENPNVVHYFSQEGMLLPQITQISTIQQEGMEVRALGISIDESWWLIPQLEPNLETNNVTNVKFADKLDKLVHDYNQHHEGRESTIAWIEQSDAYKIYHLSGINHHATELLTHLIAYDWFGLQKQLEQTQSASSQERVVATVMQTVPTVVCVQPNHQYDLIIRHSFADYTLDLLEHTVKSLG